MADWQKKVYDQYIDVVQECMEGGSNQWKDIAWKDNCVANLNRIAPRVHLENLIISIGCKQLITNIKNDFSLMYVALRLLYLSDYEEFEQSCWSMFGDYPVLS